MKKLILLIFSMFLLVSIVSATSSFVFEQDEAVDLKIACVDEIEQPCNSTIHCNITILYPNSTALVDNQVMTYGAVYYNYALNENQTATLGEYSTNIFCSGVGNGFSTFTFEINPTGHEITQSQGFSSLGLILGVILIAVMFSYFGFKFSESEKLFPVALFFMVISLIISVYAMQLGYIYSRDILWTLGIDGMQFKMLYGLMWGFIAITFLCLMWMIFKTLGELKERKSIVKDNRNSDGFDPYNRNK